MQVLYQLSYGPVGRKWLTKRWNETLGGFIVSADPGAVPCAS